MSDSSVRSQIEKLQEEIENLEHSQNIPKEERLSSAYENIKENFWHLPVFTGNNLNELAKRCQEPREPIIEGLIYRNTASLFYADDGVGKSLLLFQAISEASASLPAYGFLQTKCPVKTLWIQAERHPFEIGERLNAFSERFKPDNHNIFITDKLQGYNLKNEKHCETLIQMIDNILDGIQIDIIVIDPIYAMVHGEVSSDDCASAITRFSTLLQTRYGCSTIIIHHTNRGGRNEAGNRTEGDLYGNRFLSAHFSGIFHIKRRKGRQGSEFHCKKDTFACLTHSFKLDYDQESWVSTCEIEELQAFDRIAQFLREARTLNKSFTINEIMDEKQVGATVVKRYKRDQLKLGFIDTGKWRGRAKLYKSDLQ